MSWEGLERQDWHLWILAIPLMLFLGINLLSFMFPNVFWSRGEMALSTPQRAFFGFCVLLALALVYMLQRQATIRRLKRDLCKARSVAVEAEEAAILQAFASLPEVSQFRDLLAMEFRRAMQSNVRLAVVLLDVPNASRVTLGGIANFLRNLLRQGEKLYRVSGSAFGLILPGMQPKDAAAFAAQSEDRLGLHFTDFRVASTVIVYPEEAGGLAEFESLLRTVVH